MAKTITLRIDDEIYSLFKKAADGERRTISNFIEFAALNYLINDLYVTDEEMKEILKYKDDIKKGLEDIKKGKYTVVA